MEIESYIVATDSELVDRVREGDSGAFEYLFNRYNDALQRLYLQKTGGNIEDTEDLIQEIFVKAFLHLASYDKRYAFGQWIYTIARNTFIDYVRKRRDNLSIDNTRGEYIPPPVSLLLNPEEHIISHEQRAQIEGYMSQMSPKYRQLLELRFFKDLSYEEIAQQTGLPLGTVKTQIHRARTRLMSYITSNGI
jgi:RNA polymerase sigma-70 factor (ECF subfamily)